MATYKSEAGAILQPGNQINRLSSYNTEGVYGWPGVELYELIGYAKISNKSGTKADFKTLDLIVPSPDRRPDDRVRDDRTSLVVQASSDRPAYVYGCSLAIAQDIPSGGVVGFPASPITADLQGTNTEVLCLGGDSSGAPGIPSTGVLTGLRAAGASLSIGASGIAQGTSAVSAGKVPFLTSITNASATYTGSDFADAMMFEATSDLTFKVFNMNAVANTGAANGDGVFISDADSDAGKAAYIIARVNYLRPAAAVTWNDLQGFVDFASQVGGSDS
jgi:hypothetical protein